MAARRRNTTTYSTYGSVAYAPAYDGDAVRLPRPEQAPLPSVQPKTRQRVQRKALTRAQAQVRQAGQVAPFAVVGFLAVAVFAAMLLLSYAQQTVLNNNVVALRGQLNALQEQNVVLSAQYKKIYDIQTIQEAVGETMIRPTSDQVVYIDLPQQDSVVVYDKQHVTDGLAGALKAIGDVAKEVIEYFR
jgi:hypothetical protein